MHTIQGWAGLRLAGMALALGFLGLGPVVSADEIDTAADTTVADDLISTTSVVDDSVVETTSAPTSPAAETAAPVQAAPANPLLRFSTSGTFGDTSTISGGNLLNFNGIIQQTVRTPSNVSFGEFQVLPDLGANVSTTYEDTPFTLAMTVGEVNGQVPNLNQTPIFIEGLLNGTVTGETQSNVTATFNLDPENLPTFQVDDFIVTITKLDPVDIAPFTTNGGRTSIQGRIEAVQIPEPASIAVFLVALAGGLGLRRRALARKDA
ncbi:PEP-CTERM sorting domain-containing protein [Tautonia marina]|uniref:PEP-CTERM sorting domain-containing protein n=1 Tax=Tautonia marina TaxID=2653855 RepID=UPI0013760BEE|nr:PEP-CTERM sorting domain-containing protein [Tautonia marina]